MYEELVARGYMQMLHERTLTRNGAADMIGSDATNVSRAYAAWLEDQAQSQIEWELEDRYRRQLGFDLIERERKLVAAYWRDKTPENLVALEGLVAELIDRFVEFRDEHFTFDNPITLEPEPYITGDFAIAWIRSLLLAKLIGGRLMILSPPRHGKTDLLAHFCVWLIIRQPNIRITWVGVNKPIAKEALAGIKDMLESHEGLHAHFLPPGKTWRPTRRSARPWGSEIFTVATRTGGSFLKSPTFAAVGRGGKLLSKDIDILIVDDPEDHDSTVQPATRESTRDWWGTQVNSRVQRHTCLLLIGSRQHPDDLYSYRLDDPEFDCIVEEAHSSACQADPYDEAEATHWDCMLLPEINPYSWLMTQKRTLQADGKGHLFDMVYQNRPIAEGLQTFPEANVKHSHDHTRGLGTAGIPEGFALVAGLDPADTGYQAAFLWAYVPALDKLYLVDIDNHRGGGIPAAEAVMKDWHRKYGLRHWVVEENGFQKAVRLADQIRNWALDKSVHLEGHETWKNKWDAHFGVTAMAAWWPAPGESAPRVSLPMATPEAMAATLAYTKQLVGFSQAAASNRNARSGYKSDLVMASWFPQKVIRRWRNEWQAHDEEINEPDYDTSYPGLDLTPGFNLAPWR